MKYGIAALVLITSAFGVMGQDVVDSIVYDKGMEWKVFSSEGRAVAFTVQGGTLWQATADKVMAVNIKTNKFENYVTLGSIPAAGVTDMATDMSNAVWIGTSAGVAVTKGGKFTTYTQDNGLCSNDVTKVFVSKDGRVWVGTSKGLSTYDNGTWATFTKGKGLRGDHVKSMAQDARGAVWVGTNFGISIFHKGTWSSQSMDDGMSWNDTKALGYDERKEKMWAAVGEKDVNCYEDGKWQVYMDVRGGIKCIMVDTQSRVWIGSAEGLVKFNGTEWITDQRKLGIPARIISDMYRDTKGNLWFASENGVILLHNPYPF